MDKEQLKAQLLKKELVKPNATEIRLSTEVESLCETFSCSYNLSRATGNVDQDSDILF